MVILGCKSENAHSTANVTIGFRAIGIPKETGNSEFSALDPERGSLLDTLKSHQPTICSADKSIGIIWGLDRSGIRFQFPTEPSVSYRLMKRNATNL